MNHTHIKVRYNEQDVLLPLNVKGNLQLSILKHYFPQATGSTYLDKNQKHALLIECGEIVINHQIDNFDVHEGQGIISSFM